MPKGFKRAQREFSAKAVQTARDIALSMKLSLAYTISKCRDSVHRKGNIVGMRERESRRMSTHQLHFQGAKNKKKGERP